MREIPDQEGEQTVCLEELEEEKRRWRPRAGCEVTAELSYLGCDLLKDSRWTEGRLGWDGQLAIPLLP